MSQIGFGYEKFAAETAAIQRYISQLETLTDESASELSRTSKGFVLVWLSAALESFWKIYLAELSRAATVSSYRKLRRCLPVASVFHYQELSSLAQGKGIKRWEKLIKFFERLDSKAIAPTTIPYDGKTVRAPHLDLAWRVFSLAGPSLPSPMHKQVLETLSDRRNDIAHGDEAPASVGGALTVDDLRNIVSKIEDVVEHCVVAGRDRWA